MSAKTLAIVGLVLMILGAVLGAGAMHAWLESDRHQAAIALALEKARPPIVQEKIITETKTQLEYVKGETIYVPVPGKPEAPPVATKLDGKIELGKPNFVYTINGKPGELVKSYEEKYIFDKNMMQLTQSSTINLDVRAPEQRPSIKVGLYGGAGEGTPLGGGLEISAQSKKLDVDLNISHQKKVTAKATWWLFQ